MVYTRKAKEIGRERLRKITDRFKRLYESPTREITITTTRDNEYYIHVVTLDGKPFEVPQGANIVETYQRMNERTISSGELPEAKIVFFISPQRRLKFRR